MSAVVHYLVGLLLQGLFLLFDAWTIKTLWWWYLVPVAGFAITLKQAIGLNLVIGMMTLQQIPRDKDQALDLLKFQVLLPTLALLFGWAFKYLLGGGP